MEEKNKDGLQKTAITFMIGGLIIGFCAGVFLVTNFGLFMEQNEKIENECVFELGENVTTGNKYYSWNNYTFTGTIVDIRHDQYRNVLTVYNFTTDEIKYVDESMLSDYGIRKYKLLI